MNKNLTFEEFRTKNKLRDSQRSNIIENWSETDLTCALCGEAGELANFVKKRRRKNYPEKLHKKSIQKEIGDVITYLDLLATKYGFTLEECLKDKFNEVSERSPKSSIKL